MTQQNEPHFSWPEPIDLSTIKAREALCWPELGFIDALIASPAPIEEIAFRVRAALSIAQLAGVPPGLPWVIDGVAEPIAASRIARPADQALALALAAAGIGKDWTIINCGAPS